MLAVSCSSCGRRLEFADPPPTRVGFCPHCGQPLVFPPDPAAPRATSTPPPQPPAGDGWTSPTVAAEGAGQAPETPSPSRVWIAAPPAGQTYGFLAPARGPGELGWLGHYRVLRLVGQGGMGMVFAGQDTLLGRPIALKVLKPEECADQASRQRFLREARAMALIKSEHIVNIYEVGQVNNVPFLVMEFLQGEPLDAWLQTHPRAPVRQTLEIGLQVARGLQAAHAVGLIHRDVKPANIFLTGVSGQWSVVSTSQAADTNQEPHRNEPATGSSAQPTDQWPLAPLRVKLLDFGLARPSGDDALLTQKGFILGTPAYMAPEQAEGQAVDPRADLFSLGCVLYQLLSGELPFLGETMVSIMQAVALKTPRPLRSFNPAIPPALADLVNRLLAKSPELRPTSAAVVADTLQGLLANLPPTEPPPRVPAVPAGPTRRRLVAAILLGCLAVGVLAAVLFTLFRPGGGPLGPPRPAAQGVSDTEILFGMSATFSGTARELGREMQLGIETSFRNANKQGGVAGRKLRLVALDDGYEPDRALANMKELYEQRKVFAVVGNVGTPTAEKTLPYALEKHLLFFGAFTGAQLLRRVPPDRYVFNFRASYEEETAAIVKYLIKTRKVRPEEIAVFAQEDGYGDSGFRGVARVLGDEYRREREQIVRVGHQRNRAVVEPAVTAILRHPEIRAVVMVTTYVPAARFIAAVKKARPDMLFSNVSFVGSDALAEELSNQGPGVAEGVLITQVVPPVDSQAAAVIRFREHLQTFYPNERPSYASLEGYLDAVILEEGLRRAGHNLTTETLIDALESIKNFDLGIGTPITYGLSQHQGSHRVWATVLDGAGRLQELDLD